MSTFREVNDSVLIEYITAAQERIVFIAPGVHQAVAEALGARLVELEALQVTVIIDPDEDACRIGYGDAKGLALLSEHAERQSFTLMAQPGVRIGVLLVDCTTLVWAPTPRCIEPAPRGETASPAAGAPNGVVLGECPGEALARAVSAAGTDTLPFDAEIGVSVVPPERVRETLDALSRNPPVPVDLARITRVFSTKVQFVEFSVTGARYSKRKLNLSDHHFNADIEGDLKDMVASSIRVFSDLLHEMIEVPAFHAGQEVFDRDGRRLTERVSEASLQEQRQKLEHRYLLTVPGFGRLVDKDEKTEFEAQVNALRIQLEGHFEGIQEKLKQQSEQILDEACTLIVARAARSGALIEAKTLMKTLEQTLYGAKATPPEVKLVFKDVTYEQTKDDDFRAKLQKALPSAKQHQLGQWTRDFDAAPSADAW